MTRSAGSSAGGREEAGLTVALVDYGGYPFTLQLADALGERGHHVTYLCRDISRLRDVGGRERTDPPTSIARVVAVDANGPLEKGNLAARWLQERRFGRHVARTLAAAPRDVVLSANTPLDAQVQLLRQARRSGAGFVFWLQDLIGTATHAILQSRYGPPGGLVGGYYLGLEKRLLRHSDAIVAISPSFRSALKAHGVPDESIAVVPNWSPLEDLPECPRENAWAREQDLTERPVVLYSGSLGMKHDPGMLVALARALEGHDGADLVVVAEGAGARWLAGKAADGDVRNLRILPFQDRSVLPQVLGSADVLVALLEPSASAYSIPSKVLSYLCAGRPVVAAVPGDNDVAKLLRVEEAGLVCGPSDIASFTAAVRRLLGDPDERRRLGRNGRAYAERAFDIERIAQRFEDILAAAVAGRAGARRST